jgi:hypothetical protein
MRSRDVHSTNSEVAGENENASLTVLSAHMMVWPATVNFARLTVPSAPGAPLPIAQDLEHFGPGNTET